MSEDHSRLRIHAQIKPETESMSETKAHVRWRCVPHPKQKGQPGASREKLTFSDRLLRNSALACALLLAVLAMGNINQPWARQASETIERALTMHIDLDESIGKLTFVRELMPESALVFLNLSGNSELAAPVNGDLTHTYSEAQPWLMFACTSSSEVYAAAEGMVTAVSPLSGGSSVGVLIDHGSGLESVYAYLTEASVQMGDVVQRGQSIGRTDATLYFELRESGTAVDPTERMGL